MIRLGGQHLEVPQSRRGTRRREMEKQDARNTRKKIGRGKLSVPGYVTGDF